MSTFERFAKQYPQGTMIFSEYEPGNTFYLIQSGRVRISKIVGEFEKAIDILKPGELFGEMAILEAAPRSASAIALDDCVLLEFNKENFELIMSSNPQIALTLLRTLVKRIRDQRRRFRILKIKDIHARIGDVFMMLNEGSAARFSEDERREFSITTNDVAHWAGVSPEKARLIINQFVKQNKMAIFGNKIVVTNIHDLERFISTRQRET
jgi:CRP-like cAMP-binding protein